MEYLNLYKRLNVVQYILFYFSCRGTNKYINTDWILKIGPPTNKSKPLQVYSNRLSLVYLHG